MPIPSRYARPTPARASPGRLWSIGELVQEVNRWCEEHRIAPASGQAAEHLTERNVRYYRTRGLLDAPGTAGNGRGRAADGRRGFTDKHAAQLRLIRLFQARGLPLEHIHDQLQDRPVEELLAMERRELGAPELPMSTGLTPEPEKTVGTGANGVAGASPALIAGQEQWLVSPLGVDFLLVSRRGQAISDEQRRLIVAVLRA